MQSTDEKNAIMTFFHVIKKLLNEMNLFKFIYLFFVVGQTTVYEHERERNINNLMNR
jgi:hypothetical protein